MSEIAVVPHFIIDGEKDNASGATAEVPKEATELAYIDRSIRDNPEAFHRALTRLGETATAGTLALTAIDTELTTLEQGASGLLTKFFSKRLDLGVEFDEDTEDALAQDPDHRQLIEKHRQLRSINSQQGPMKHEVVANPLAEPTRDAVRRSRMAFFIARTLDYQLQKQPEQKLPSAV